jgi:GNAT superfamily N-acetyltransferase
VSALAKASPAPPRIRPASDADVLPMAKVHILSWRETYPGILPQPMLARLSIAEEAIRWQRMLDRPRAWGGAMSFVADQDCSVVGYGSCGEQRSELLRERGFTGEVSELYVLRSAQGLGAGSGLMKAMASALLDRGHRAMSLWVLEQNMPARGFYERLGGIPIARKPNRVPEIAYGWTDLGLLSGRAESSC